MDTAIVSLVAIVLGIIVFVLTFSNALDPMNPAPF
jgi:hypothetical protein